MLLAPVLAALAGLLAGLGSSALVRRWPPGGPGPGPRWAGPAVAAASAALAGIAVAAFGAGPRGLAAAVLLTALAPVVAIDLRHRLVPDVVVLPAAAAGGALAALAEPSRWWVPALAAAGAAGFLLALWAAHPAGMGLGDVKLALLMGAVLGASVIAALAIAFAAGAVVAAAVLVRRGRRARGTGIPFTPPLALGAAAALWVGPPLVGWYTGALA